MNIMMQGLGAQISSMIIGSKAVSKQGAIIAGFPPLHI